MSLSLSPRELSLSPRESPRETYVSRYLSNPIVLNAKSLFQVSMHPDQFIHYQPITQYPSIECFIQTLFSLGLREKRAAVRDIIRLNGYRIGTEWGEASRYLQRSFGLNDGQIYHEWNLRYFNNNDEFVERTNTILNDELDNNYATILTIRFIRHDRTGLWGHYIIAYKHENRIFYFDPQTQNITEDARTIVRDGHYVNNVGIFRVTDVTTPIPLQSNTCYIQFIGGIAKY